MKKSDNSNPNSKMVYKTMDLISIIFLSLVCLLSLTFCIGLLLTNAALRRQADASRSEIEAIESEGYYTTAQTEQLVDKAVANARLESEEEVRKLFQSVLEQKGSLSAIRELFPEDIIVSSDGEYHFYPIDENIEHNNAYGKNFETNENGFLLYNGNDFSYETGVLVSRYQGEIDFEKVAQSGISFVMIRAGLRGNAEGTLLEDDYFEENISAATDAGLKVGIYFESTAINPEEAEEEAQFVLDLIDPFEISYPVAILIETPGEDDRNASLSRADYTAIANAFCNKIEEGGQSSMVYGDAVTFTEILSEDFVNNSSTWISIIGDKMYYPYKIDLWEYTDSGIVDGISGKVSLIMDITDSSSND